MLLVSLFFVFSIMFVVPSYALNLENKILISNDDDLIIEFGDNTVRSLLTKTVTTPNIEFGIITLIDQEILLESFDNISVKVSGRSIIVTAYDVPMVIYARNIGDDNFSINLYTVENGKFIKEAFLATLETTSAIEGESTAQSESKIIEGVVTEPLINVLTAHLRNVDEGDQFRFVVKTFDINKYDGNDWSNFYGALDGVDIHAELLGSTNEILQTVDGVTENGIFEGRILVRENLWPEGWYTLSLNAFYKGDTFQDDLKFFIQSAFVQSGNKAPTANAGPDQPVSTNDPVTLDGSGSSDPTDPITFSWTQIEVITTTVTLSSDTAEKPTFTAPADAEILTFQLTVSDTRGKSSSDTVIITVS